MAFAELWLPIIGAGICIAWAIGAWYGGSQVLAIWLAFIGIVCLLLLGTIQIQHSLRDVEQPGAVSPEQKELMRARLTVGNFKMLVVAPNQPLQLQFRVFNNAPSEGQIIDQRSGFGILAGFPDDFRQHEEEIRPPVNANIGPHSSKLAAQVWGNNLTQSQYDDVIARRAFIQYWGEITYTDIYGGTWRTRYGGTYDIATQTFELPRLPGVNYSDRAASADEGSSVFIERAYIDFGEGQASPKPFVVFNNFGHSVAQQLVIRTAIGVRDLPLVEGFPEPNPPNPGKADLPPGGRLYSGGHVRVLTPNEQSVINAGTAALFVWGIATYSIRGTEHHTRYRLYSDTGPRFHNGGLRAYSEGNSSD